MRFFIGQASDLDLIPTRGEPFSIREEDILVVEANVTSGKLQIFEGHSPLVAVIRDDVVAFQDFQGNNGPRPRTLAVLRLTFSALVMYVYTKIL
jgi:hypothetical protein